MRWLFAMNYAHWLMVTGAVLIILGFIGFAFRENRKIEPDHEPETKSEK